MIPVDGDNGAIDKLFKEMENKTRQRSVFAKYEPPPRAIQATSFSGRLSMYLDDMQQMTKGLNPLVKGILYVSPVGPMLIGNDLEVAVRGAYRYSTVANYAGQSATALNDPIMRARILNYENQEEAVNQAGEKVEKAQMAPYTNIGAQSAWQHTKDTLTVLGAAKTLEQQMQASVSKVTSIMNNLPTNQTALRQIVANFMGVTPDQVGNMIYSQNLSAAAQAWSRASIYFPTTYNADGSIAVSTFDSLAAYSKNPDDPLASNSIPAQMAMLKDGWTVGSRSFNGLDDLKQWSDNREASVDAAKADLYQARSDLAATQVQDWKDIQAGAAASEKSSQSLGGGGNAAAKANAALMLAESHDFQMFDKQGNLLSDPNTVAANVNSSIGPMSAKADTGQWDPHLGNAYSDTLKSLSNSYSGIYQTVMAPVLGLQQGWSQPTIDDGMAGFLQKSWNATSGGFFGTVNLAFTALAPVDLAVANVVYKVGDMAGSDWLKNIALSEESKNFLTQVSGITETDLIKQQFGIQSDSQLIATMNSKGQEVFDTGVPTLNQFLTDARKYVTDATGETFNDAPSLMGHLSISDGVKWLGTDAVNDFRNKNYGNAAVAGLEAVSLGGFKVGADILAMGGASGVLGALPAGALRTGLEISFLRLPGYKFFEQAGQDIADVFQGLTSNSSPGTSAAKIGGGLADFGSISLGAGGARTLSGAIADLQAAPTLKTVATSIWNLPYDLAMNSAYEGVKFAAGGIATDAAGAAGMIGTGVIGEQLTQGYQVRFNDYAKQLQQNPTSLSPEQLTNPVAAAPKDIQPAWYESVAGARFSPTSLEVAAAEGNKNLLLGVGKAVQATSNLPADGSTPVLITNETFNAAAKQAADNLEVGNNGSLSLYGRQLTPEEAQNPVVMQALKLRSETAASGTLGDPNSGTGLMATIERFFTGGSLEPAAVAVGGEGADTSLRVALQPTSDSVDVPPSLPQSADAKPLQLDDRSLADRRAELGKAVTEAQYRADMASTDGQRQAALNDLSVAQQKMAAQLQEELLRTHLNITSPADATNAVNTIRIEQGELKAEQNVTSAQTELARTQNTPDNPFARDAAKTKVLDAQASLLEQQATSSGRPEDQMAAQNARQKANEAAQQLETNKLARQLDQAHAMLDVAKRTEQTVKDLAARLDALTRPDNITPEAWQSAKEKVAAEIGANILDGGKLPQSWTLQEKMYAQSYKEMNGTASPLPAGDVFQKVQEEIAAKVAVAQSGVAAAEAARELLNAPNDSLKAAALKTAQADASLANAKLTDAAAARSLADVQAQGLKETDSSLQSARANKALTQANVDRTAANQQSAIARQTLADPTATAAQKAEARISLSNAIDNAKASGQRIEALKLQSDELNALNNTKKHAADVQGDFNGLKEKALQVNSRIKATQENGAPANARDLATLESLQKRAQAVSEGKPLPTEPMEKRLDTRAQEIEKAQAKVADGISVPDGSIPDPAQIMASFEDMSARLSEELAQSINTAEASARLATLQADKVSADLSNSGFINEIVDDIKIGVAKIRLDLTSRGDASKLDIQGNSIIARDLTPGESRDAFTVVEHMNLLKATQERDVQAEGQRAILLRRGVDVIKGIDFAGALKNGSQNGGVTVKPSADPKKVPEIIVSKEFSNHLRNVLEQTGLVRPEVVGDLIAEAYTQLGRIVENTPGMEGLGKEIKLTWNDIQTAKNVNDMLKGIHINAAVSGGKSYLSLRAGLTRLLTDTTNGAATILVRSEAAILQYLEPKYQNVARLFGVEIVNLDQLAKDGKWEDFVKAMEDPHKITVATWTEMPQLLNEAMDSSSPQTKQVIKEFLVREALRNRITTIDEAHEFVLDHTKAIRGDEGIPVADLKPKYDPLVDAISEAVDTRDITGKDGNGSMKYSLDGKNLILSHELNDSFSKIGGLEYTYSDIKGVLKAALEQNDGKPGTETVNLVKATDGKRVVPRSDMGGVQPQRILQDKAFLTSKAILFADSGEKIDWQETRAGGKTKAASDPIDLITALGGQKSFTSGTELQYRDLIRVLTGEKVVSRGDAPPEIQILKDKSGNVIGFEIFGENKQNSSIRFMSPEKAPEAFRSIVSESTDILFERAAWEMRAVESGKAANSVEGYGQYIGIADVDRQGPRFIQAQAEDLATRVSEGKTYTLRDAAGNAIATYSANDLVSHLLGFDGSAKVTSVSAEELVKGLEKRYVVLNDNSVQDPTNIDLAKTSVRNGDITLTGKVGWVGVSVEGENLRLLGYGIEQNSKTMVNQLLARINRQNADGYFQGGKVTLFTSMEELNGTVSNLHSRYGTDFDRMWSDRTGETPDQKSENDLRLSLLKQYQSDPSKLTPLEKFQLAIHMNETVDISEAFNQGAGRIYEKMLMSDPSRKFLSYLEEKYGNTGTVYLKAVELYQEKVLDRNSDLYSEFPLETRTSGADILKSQFENNAGRVQKLEQMVSKSRELKAELEAFRQFFRTSEVADVLKNYNKDGYFKGTENASMVTAKNVREIVGMIKTAFESKILSGLATTGYKPESYALRSAAIEKVRSGGQLTDQELLRIQNVANGDLAYMQKIGATPPGLLVSIAFTQNVSSLRKLVLGNALSAGSLNNGLLSADMLRKANQSIGGFGTVYSQTYSMAREQGMSPIVASWRALGQARASQSTITLPPLLALQASADALAQAETSLALLKGQGRESSEATELREIHLENLTNLASQLGVDPAQVGNIVHQVTQSVGKKMNQATGQKVGAELGGVVSVAINAPKAKIEVGDGFVVQYILKNGRPVAATMYINQMTAEAGDKAVSLSALLKVPGMKVEIRLAKGIDPAKRDALEKLAGQVNAGNRFNIVSAGSFGQSLLASVPLVLRHPIDLMKAQSRAHSGAATGPVLELEKVVSDVELLKKIESYSALAAHMGKDAPAADQIERAIKARQQAVESDLSLVRMAAKQIKQAMDLGLIDYSKLPSVVKFLLKELSRSKNTSADLQSAIDLYLEQAILDAQGKMTFMDLPGRMKVVQLGKNSDAISIMKQKLEGLLKGAPEAKFLATRLTPTASAQAGAKLRAGNPVRQEAYSNLSSDIDRYYQDLLDIIKAEQSRLLRQPPSTVHRKTLKAQAAGRAPVTIADVQTVRGIVQQAYAETPASVFASISNLIGHVTNPEGLPVALVVPDHMDYSSLQTLRSQFQDLQIITEGVYKDYSAEAAKLSENARKTAIETLMPAVHEQEPAKPAASLTDSAKQLLYTPMMSPERQQSFMRAAITAVSVFSIAAVWQSLSLQGIHLPDITAWMQPSSPSAVLHSGITLPGFVGYLALRYWRQFQRAGNAITESAQAFGNAILQGA